MSYPVAPAALFQSSTTWLVVVAVSAGDDAVSTGAAGRGRPRGARARRGAGPHQVAIGPHRQPHLDLAVVRGGRGDRVRLKVVTGLLVELAARADGQVRERVVEHVSCVA